MRRALVLVLAGSLLPVSAAHAERKPMELPAPGATASAAAKGRWLLGVRGDAGERAAVAAGATRLGVPGTVTVPVARARRVADALKARGLLSWAQADVELERQSAVEGQEAGWARGAVINPALPVPTIGPKIGVVDDTADPTHPDLAGLVTPLNDRPIEDVHGTMVASAAAGARNGSGVLGTFPGSPVLSWGTDLTCGDIARGIETARAAGAAVINLSLGSPGECTAITVAVMRAIASGRVVVAASGNEFAEGNPVIYPAASPHVLSVAAVGQDLKPTGFSTANAAVDVAAPGAQVPLAIPVAADTRDGVQDGVTLSDGTSFSAPMVSGMAAWLVAARPGLDALQYGDLLRSTAIDVAAPGYDRDTGFGLVSMERALNAPTPPRDVLEPNDGITYVDGTLFGRADTPVSTGRSRTITATTDLIEDPVDVYRVRVPARKRVGFTLRPTSGQVDLAVYDGSAEVLDDDPVDVSTRSGTRTDTVRIRNTTRRVRTAYVAVAPSQRSRQLNARYRLTVGTARR